MNLAGIFNDHMVLQRNALIPIWGTAEPREHIEVLFQKHRRTAIAGDDGRWKIMLPELNQSGPSTMTVRGKTAVEVNDVAVGEVWFCSGQCNMVFTMARSERLYFAGVENSEEEIAGANFPEIRCFTAQWNLSSDVQTDLSGTWVPCTPASAGAMSAVAYYFGRELFRQLGTPIGLIVCALGRSTAQAWISREAIKREPRLAHYLQEFNEKVKAYTPVRARADEAALTAWRERLTLADNVSRINRRKPRSRDPRKNPHNRALIFNGMVAPVIPFGIRGVLWYQGESNQQDGAAYTILQNTLIADWRSRWGHNSLPFIFVQMPGYRQRAASPVGSQRLARFREFQAATLKVENTAMAVTIDIGDVDIHPKNKADVGRRLALQALVKVYNMSIECDGPQLDYVVQCAGSLTLRFKHADGGLRARRNEVRGLAMGNDDHNLMWTGASIEEDRLLVPLVSEAAPRILTYAWADNPEAPLYNIHGLPARPFRIELRPSGMVSDDRSK